jgi:hypothetical protein
MRTLRVRGLPSSTWCKQVALAIVPQAAHVFDGDKDLGTSPVLLQVEEGKPRTLSVRMDGYKEKELVVDGSEPRKSVQLERATSRSAAVAGRPVSKRVESTPEAAPKKGGSLGGGEIVDPWKQPKPKK